MPVDIILVKAVMQCLVALDGNPVPREQLASEVEIRMARPLTTQAVDDALAWCKTRGWAQSRKDDFQRDVWVATETGKSA